MFSDVKNINLYRKGTTIMNEETSTKAAYDKLQSSRIENVT
jgi:hypothetical protein